MKTWNKRRELIIWLSCVAVGLIVLVAESREATRRASQRINDARLPIASYPRQQTQRFATTLTCSPINAVIPVSAANICDYLVESVAQVESSGNARMIGRSGERGLMQIKKGTWAQMTDSLFGHSVSFDKAFNPSLNKKVGEAYLAYLKEFLAENRGRWKADERSLMLACYNAGPYAVRQAGFNVRALPNSTRDYVKRVSALHDFLRKSQQATASTRLAAAADGV